MPLLTRSPKKDKVEPVKGKAIPKGLEEKLNRGRDAKNKDRTVREMCVRFWKGDQNSIFGEKNTILRLAEVTTTRGGKEPHRMRQKYNFLASLIEGKVSASTQRVPSYEVIQSTSDHRDYTAARLAEKVAVYLYDELNMRRMTTKVVTDALVQREGFAMPYFDPNVGPFVSNFKTGPDGEPTEEIETVGMGEIKIATYNRDEVMWEQGEDFKDSRWYATESDMLIERVERIPGFVGGKLTPNVQDNAEKVVLTVYYERPCPDYPDGRRLFIANERVIVEPENEEDGFYPLRDHKGEVIDKPVLHRLSYTVNPKGDDLGLVERLIDPQRTINDCMNKLGEWKNRCLMPKMLAIRGSIDTHVDDSPGQIIYYTPRGGEPPKWETPPAIPRELFDMVDLALTQMRALAADIDVQPDPRLTTGTANAAIEQSQARWQSFLGDLAEFHSRLMRHCLTLVARHYTDARLVELRGQYSWETLEDFKGQDLYGQVNTRVRPEALETKGRTRRIEDLTFMQTNYPNSIPAEAAWSSLQNGNGDGMLLSYELDVAAAWRLVEQLRKGPEFVFALPKRFDPDLAVEVPGYMPRKQHNIVIFKQVIADAMKSAGFDDLPPETQHLFDLVWSDLERLELARAMAMQVQEQSAAADLGMANAAAPQTDAQLPAQPGMSREQGNPAN